MVKSKPEEWITFPYPIGYNSEATGNPYPLDLVDSDVALPEDFTNEFIEEVVEEVRKSNSIEEGRI